MEADLFSLQMIYTSQLKKWTLMTCFVVQGHILPLIININVLSALNQHMTMISERL